MFGGLQMNKKNSNVNHNKKNTDKSKALKEKKNTRDILEVKEIKSSNESLFTGKYFTLFIGMVLLIIIIGVFILSPFQSKGQDYSTYRGFAFAYLAQDEVWLTHIQIQGNIFEAPFYNHPYDLETASIAYSPSVLEKFLQTEKIVIAIPPHEPSSTVLAGVNIARITGRFYQIPTMSALFVPLQEHYLFNGSQHPLVDCSFARPEQLVIVLTTEKQGPIITEDKNNPYCIYVGSASKEQRPHHDLLAVADYLVYRLVGIMK